MKLNEFTPPPMTGKRLIAFQALPGSEIWPQLRKGMRHAHVKRYMKRDDVIMSMMMGHGQWPSG